VSPLASPFCSLPGPSAPRVETFDLALLRLQSFVEYAASVLAALAACSAPPCIDLHVRKHQAPCCGEWGLQRTPSRYIRPRGPAETARRAPRCSPGPGFMRKRLLFYQREIAGPPEQKAPSPASGVTLSAAPHVSYGATIIPAGHYTLQAILACAGCKEASTSASQLLALGRAYWWHQNGRFTVGQDHGDSLSQEMVRIVHAEGARREALRRTSQAHDHTIINPPQLASGS
jgi:hypothetical protein